MSSHTYNYRVYIISIFTILYGFIVNYSSYMKQQNVNILYIYICIHIYIHILK